MNIKSIANHIKFSLSDEKPLEKPIVLQIPVNDTCNSRCQMCRIWENKKSDDITVDALRKGLSSNLFDNVEGVGFNGGEPTLREDLYELVVAAIDKLPNLKHISLITNAYKYSQVIEQIEKIGNLVKSKNKHFDVMVSLDGYGQIHDKVRGRSGNFENAKKVLLFLKGFECVDNVRVGCTVIKENVLHLADLFEFCIENDVYIKYRQGVPHQRLYTENLLDPYSLTFEEKYEFVEFLEGLIKYYEPNYMQKLFYRSLIDQVINDKPRSAGCDWKHRGATITARGELAYCAVKSDVIMNDISQGNPYDSYFEAEKHLKTIVDNECASCHHDYVGIPSATEYRKMMMERLEQKFNLKYKIRSIYGFTKLNKFRRKNAYSNQISYYRNQEHFSVSTSEKTKNILICGWYGTETLGDKGIIGGVMHSFRALYGEDIKFTVIALCSYITEITRRQMPEFKNTQILSPEDGIKIINSMDYVVFGGGPLMAIDSLAPMQVIFEKAKSWGVKTVVSGCGVGPLGEKWHNESIKTILDIADVRIYRDKRSKEYASELGVNVKNDMVAEDPAFTWLASIERQLDDPAVDTEKNKVLLLGLRDFPYKEYARHIPESRAIEIKGNYEKVVIESLEELSMKHPNLIIRPLPMCTNHHGSDDRWFYRKLFRGNNNLQKCLDYSLLGAEMPPIEYCKAFRQADALVAMRFHSLVFGLGLGVNSIGLDYTLGKGKVNSLAERFNVPLISMIDFKKEVFVNAIEESLKDIKPAPITFEHLSFEKTLIDSLRGLN